MPRGVYLLGLGLALALAFTDWALSLWPGVTEANVKRIRPGRVQAEAETLLGGPPASIRDLDLKLMIGPSGIEPEPTRWVAVWVGLDGKAVVHFDRPAGVDFVAFWPNRDRAGPFARLRAWLGW